MNLTAKDIELIESALHTQKKILSVQSEAGGTQARRRLSELTHLIKRVNRAARTPCAENHSALSRLSRIVFGGGSGCNEMR